LKQLTLDQPGFKDKPASESKSVNFQLQKGDALILITDGLSTVSKKEIALEVGSSSQADAIASNIMKIAESRNELSLHATDFRETVMGGQGDRTIIVFLQG
jgi:predicted ATP-dependent serine protease